MKNTLITWVFAFLPLSLSAVAIADSLEGEIVATAGYDQNAVLRSSASDESLCGGSDSVAKLRRYSGFTGKVTGAWKLTQSGKRRCFEVKTWTLTKTSTGREPVIGSFAQKDGQYVVNKADGAAVIIADPPPGLKALVGKKVLLDLKGSQGAGSAKGTANSVVTYSEFIQ